MLVRVRSKVGTWRIEIEDGATVADLVKKIEEEKKVNPSKLSLDPSGKEDILLNRSKQLSKFGIVKGTMLYLEFSGEYSAMPLPSGTASRQVDSQGNVVVKSSHGANAFRPGLNSLRTHKLHWTLTDMVELDNQYTFNIKGEQRSFSASASLDFEACNNFQEYARLFAFQRPRCAILYGKFVDVGSENPGDDGEKEKRAPPKPRKMKLEDLDLESDAKPKQGVRVEAIYEPLQDLDNGFFRLLEDPRERNADLIAESLGLERVGFLFCHPPREGYHMSTHEIINSGHQVLEATDGALDSPFVVVTCTIADGAHVAFEGWSLTPQCIEMVAEDALVLMPDNPGHSAVHETFTAIVEMKAATVIDNDFFLKRVAISNHTSPVAGGFPRFNRDSELPDKNALRKELQSLGRNPSNKAFAEKLADFHLLMYLAEMLDQESVVQICKFVASYTVGDASQGCSLEEGYKMMVMSMAGLEI